MQIELIKPDFDNGPFDHVSLPPKNPKRAIAILRHRIAVQKALHIIEARMQDLPTLGELASLSGLSRTYFSNLFRKVTDMRLQDYFAQSRLDRAKELLGNVDLKIKQVAYQVGFRDPNYFCRFFREKTGLTPTNWRLGEIKNPHSPNW